MKIYIVIPAHNEEAYLAQTLQSLVEQTLLPNKIVVVNDASTDGTQEIIDRFSKEHSFIVGLPHFTPGKHEPGSKVVTAFYSGFDVLDDEFDVLCKFDADLIFPPIYLERIVSHFKENPRCGMAGGFCYIEKQGTWQLENLTNKDHIRGALKAYRKECFQQIGGLQVALHNYVSITTDNKVNCKFGTTAVVQFFDYIQAINLETNLISNSENFFLVANQGRLDQTQLVYWL